VIYECKTAPGRARPTKIWNFPILERQFTTANPNNRPSAAGSEATMAGSERTRVPPENDDVQLLHQASRGDENAFAELYRRHQGGIYRFVLQMTGSRHIAEEVTQEVFLTLARAPEAFDPARALLRSFLYGIARNHALRAVERETAHKCEADDAVSDAMSFDPTPVEGLVRSEEIEAVRRAVLSLPPTYREPVVLCDLQEMSYAEAALVLGCPVGTVRSKLSRGRALLYEKLSAAQRCCV
jgi:RNA polymerase sigma-70 factor, ECF subfamily